MHQVLLAIHVWSGAIGLVTGSVSLLLRKGAAPHRAAGALFVFTMLLLATSATVLAISKASWSLTLGGIMALYMIATGWMSAHRKDGQVGTFEVWSFVLAVGVAIGLAAFGVLFSARVVIAPNDDVANAVYPVCGAMTLAALGDLSVILRRGLAGKQRIARHLWRMCFGLFIATGSFAAQGSKMLPLPPEAGPPILFGSMFIIFAAMCFWLLRVLFTRWYESG